MALTGKDYHAAFEEACQELPYATGEEEVRSSLEGIEWVLWEAIRGVFLYAAVLIAVFIVATPAYVFVSDRTWITSAISFGIWILIACALYWLFRLIFHFEIAAHVKGRRFGSGGLVG